MGKGRGKGFGGKGKGKGKGGGKRKGGKGKGKRKGGKGKGKGGRGKGGGGGYGDSGAVARGLPADASSCFLKPQKRQVIPVPLEFSSLREWCEIIGNNILAEFWYLYAERRSVFNAMCSVRGNEVRIENAKESFAQHLFLIDGALCMAQTASMRDNAAVVQVKPAPRAQGFVKVLSLGYIGSYMAELGACLELPKGQITPLHRSIIQPRNDFPGDYAPPVRDAAGMNPNQKKTVDSLRFALEKIQGPPGTGKSTTIFYILTQRILPLKKRVLVTCSRNVAVESLAQKLEASGVRLVVFGNKARIGATARRWLVDNQSFEQPRVLQAAEHALEHAARLEEVLKPRAGLSPLWRRAMIAYRRHLNPMVAALESWCRRVGMIGMQLAGSEWCSGQKRVLFEEARIFLCTIASTSRMMREWQEECGEEVDIHTIVVDECGCTAESSTALLLKLRPSNLILLGDHKQLRPTSMIPPQQLDQTGHDRSLLERCILASGQVHRLNIQYRMHERIADLVSALYYNGRLVTPSWVQKERAGSTPLVSYNVNGREALAEKSYWNAEEVTVVGNLVKELTNKHPRSSIAVITFYKGQVGELMKRLPESPNLEVLTADSCQGSEFDYVILSCVRTWTLGFITNSQRICVAISRAKRQLHVVCCGSLLRTDSEWSEVLNRCTPSKGSYSAPLQPIPDGESVYDALMRLKQQQNKDLQALMDQQPSQRPRQQKGQFQRDANAHYTDRDTWQRQEMTRLHHELLIPKPSAPYRPPTAAQFDILFPMLGPSEPSVPTSKGKMPGRAKQRAKTPPPAPRKVPPSNIHHRAVTPPAPILQDAAEPGPQAHVGLNREALEEIFGHARVQLVLTRFSDLPDIFDRALEVLLEEGLEKRKEYDIIGVPCQGCGALVDDAEEEEEVYCPACWAAWSDEEGEDGEDDESDKDWNAGDWNGDEYDDEDEDVKETEDTAQDAASTTQPKGGPRDITYASSPGPTTVRATAGISYYPDVHTTKTPPAGASLPAAAVIYPQHAAPAAAAAAAVTSRSDAAVDGSGISSSWAVQQVEDFGGLVLLAPKTDRWMDDKAAIVGSKSAWDNGKQDDIRKRFEKDEKRDAKARDMRHFEETLRDVGVDEDIRAYVCSMIAEDEEIDAETLGELLAPWMSGEQVEALLLGFGLSS
eukprot:GEMP01004190.1.p1 GENE.GEMP01004190.1~~GEMP01004190.1.p1  ORF type:complete len:1162 (+),score=330.64 GEMP01004190.1:287-3772(+)